MLSASGDGRMKSANSQLQANIAANAYTLGNARQDDHQVTLPSMTEQSNIVM